MATIVLGPFTQYEKPPDLVVTLEDSSGTALDITGYDVQASWSFRGSDTITTFTCSLTTDGSDGQISVPWGTQATSPFDTAGTVEMEVWAGDSTTRYASEKIRFRVRRAVVTTEPTI